MQNTDVDLLMGLSFLKKKKLNFRRDIKKVTILKLMKDTNHGLQSQSNLYINIEHRFSLKYNE